MDYSVAVTGTVKDMLSILLFSLERAEKDGAQDLTINYACGRMLYGRGRCVIGTLSVVDRVRVLLPLIRKKCHDALL
ncbi:hypothetical protein TSUD_65210 [Trifolium subterraneum]|uniref:Uncharacterized protein n=1 Tax=Trifolium subterraneum TaxID=3900 RepID=A0A2Z6N0L5_TRISU|nr:hypothetical protein TSUD_65210 [Trifolium subterraneum]